MSSHSSPSPSRRRTVTPETRNSNSQSPSPVLSSSSSSRLDPVVGSLPKLPIPYSSLSLSPDRQHAVAASKDTLHVFQINPGGLSLLKTIPVAQHFRSETNKTRHHPLGANRETFTIFGSTEPATRPAMVVNVMITDVAWNKGTQPSDNELESSVHSTGTSSQEASSLIAAAGSNGVIVVWHAESLVRGGATPDAVLSQHARAVNRLDWHPTRPSWLLSASQDAKVLLWERQKVEGEAEAPSQNRFHRLFAKAPVAPQGRFTWKCRASFEPKSEAVRDIRWNPHLEDIFALVTSSGSLIAYNAYVHHRAMVKMTAHAGEATTLDWHPRQRGIIATGGAADRCVKVWNLLDKLNMEADDTAATPFSNTWNSNTWTSKADSATDSSTENEGSLAHLVSIGSSTGLALSSRLNSSTPNRRGAAQNVLHTLSISASVTRLRWRPLSSTESSDVPDLHETMIAVATSSIKGASAGGAGQVSLWSWSRPFMAVSILEGHLEGAIPDFEWLDTPSVDVMARQSARPKTAVEEGCRDSIGSRSGHDQDVSFFETTENDNDHGMNVWQHVLSVGRDGRCLVQSFARGERPISQVPPSCFAMANLSPFQMGYGSLQIFSVCQVVPSGPQDDYRLTGLRRDLITSRAPGMFREEPSAFDDDRVDRLPEQWTVGSRIPGEMSEMHFNVIDQGNLDELDNEDRPGIAVAPEVVHFSRFADRYEYYLGEKYETRVEICLHNARVAQGLRFEQLAEMWQLVATMLDTSGVDGLPDEYSHLGGNSNNNHVMEFLLFPAIASMLEDRANAGDLQTCVTLCEVLRVVTIDERVQLPNLELELVREWYLAYIDILRDMCLFSQATHLIRNCLDPYIRALNKQSTTMHECCPNCGKPLDQHEDPMRRKCKSCRRRIGFCFICHEQVQGLYVWCPGCGHGGHLEHALDWFGSGREFCPTGCGHRCNLLQQLNAFPRTESWKETHPSTSNSNEQTMDL